MSNKFLEFFKEPPVAEPLTDEAEIKKTYSHFRWRIFYSSFIAYVVFHLCRKNIAVALPAMGTDLGISNTQLGILGSTLYVTYGIGKFVNGVIADKANVRTFLPTALILSAICNICFILSSIFITPGEGTFFGLPKMSVLLWIMAFFWGANGWFQSCGFPPVAKSLSYWFSNSERGTKWSIWSTSHQVGVFGAVALSGLVIEKLHDWRAAFYVPAILCIITGIWLFNRLRDKPQTMGLPDIEKYNNEPAAKADDGDEDNRTYFQVFKENILCNPIIWMLAIAYVFVYIIRFGTEDWLVKYLVDVKGNGLAIASAKLSTLALVGSAGAIAAGVISDRLFKGNRTPVNIIFLIMLIVSLYLFATNPSGGIHEALDYVYAAMIGVFTAGPQMLIGGLCAVESSSKKVASASIGFTGVFGYVGAALSAAGTGFVVDKFGWNGAIAFWMISTMICVGICTILLIYEKNKKKKA